MRLRSEPIRDKVIVITGATSGIGLATARLLATHRARLVLAARNEEALERLCRELSAVGAEAVYAVADVADCEQVRGISRKAIASFGGFDVWINNAAVAMFGRVLEVPIEDERRLFDVNFWGTVHGCRVAVEHLRHKRGVIINVGSVASQRALPWQGTYSATKHAVKAYTEALRMELRHARIRVPVTLIKPGAIDTPWVRHARNHLGRQIHLPSPVYAPEFVARVIAACIERPRRDVIVGGGAWTLIAMEKVAPSLADLFVRKVLAPLELTDEKAPRTDALYGPAEPELLVRPDSSRRVFQKSIYTQVMLHRFRTGVALASLFAGAKWAGARQ